MLNKTKNIFLKKDIKNIVSNFKNKQVGIFPTDTIYGIGGRADKINVIKKVYSLKKRSKKKPLLVLVSSVTMAKKYVKINKQQEKFLKKYWYPYAKASGHKPCALTAVLESKGILPRELTSGTDTVGVRLPDDKFLLKIIRRLKIPLIATSADLPEQKNILDFKDIKIKADFFVNGGKLPPSKESTVVDLTGDEIKVLRQGDVKLKKII